MSESTGPIKASANETTIESFRALIDLAGSVLAGTSLALFVLAVDHIPWTLVLCLLQFVIVSMHIIKHKTVIFPVGLTLIAIAVQRFWPANTVVSIYWHLKVAFEALESEIAYEIVGADGPYEDWAFVQREQRYLHMSFFSMSHFLNSGSTVYEHITRNMREYDPVSRYALVFVIFRTIRCAKSYSAVGLLSSFLVLRQSWKTWWGRCKVAWARLVYNSGSRVREYFERKDKWRIDFENKPEFKHSPLRDGHIRLLMLPQRLIDSGLLRLEVLHIPLSHAKKLGYEALSYTWGDGRPTRDILLDDQRFSISDNLYELLHARSSCWKTRIVWVDGICIDQRQEANDEKASQVQLMKDIYKEARRVIAWLGTSYDSSIAASTMLDVVRETRSWRSSKVPWNQVYLHWDTQGPEWKAFINLLCHPYFTRAWICQEASLGNDLQFYIGGYYFRPWLIFEIIISIQQPEAKMMFATDHQQCSSAVSQMGRNWILVHCLRERKEKNAPVPLGLMLLVTQGFKSTLPQDKVYAMLGISNSALANQIKPDYNRTPQEVFLSTAVDMVESGEDVEYTLLFAGIGWPGRMSGLPSWVTDWTAVSEESIATLSTHWDPGVLEFTEALGGNLTARLPAFRASGDTRPKFQCLHDGKVLVVEGTMVDTINRKGRVLGKVNPETTTMRDLLDELVALFESTSHGKVSSEDPSYRADAFWRTLVADTSHKERPCPTEWSNVFQSWQTWASGAGHLWFDTQQGLVLKKVLGLKTSYDNGLGADQNAEIQAFGTRFAESCSRRRFITTREGRIGLAPPGTEEGDLICLILGHQTPFVVRQVGSSDSYQLVGECYLHGAMYGTLLDESAVTSLQLI